MVTLLIWVVSICGIFLLWCAFEASRCSFSIKQKFLPHFLLKIKASQPSVGLTLSTLLEASGGGWRADPTRPRGYHKLLFFWYVLPTQLVCERERFLHTASPTSSAREHSIVRHLRPAADNRPGDKLDRLCKSDRRPYVVLCYRRHGLRCRGRRPLRRPGAQEGVLRRRPQARLPEARHDMASGPVLGVRQLGARGGGQGAFPGDPERLLRALRLRQAAPLRRRRLRQRRRRPQRARCVGDGRLLRGDGRDDEPGHANRQLRGAAAAVRGHVPGRPRRRRVRRCATYGPPGQDPGPDCILYLWTYVCASTAVK
ncbi:hypothetical protein VPH35_127813 [Triticum aestivum]